MCAGRQITYTYKKYNKKMEETFEKKQENRSQKKK